MVTVIHYLCSSDGWLHRLGMVDVAGGGPVHLLGAVTGLVATMMLKPRLGRYRDNEVEGRMACPTNALLGMFMLWLEHILLCQRRKIRHELLCSSDKSVDYFLTTCFFFFFSFMLFPHLCGKEVRWHTPACSTVVHFIGQQSLLFDIIRYFV